MSGQGYTPGPWVAVDTGMPEIQDASGWALAQCRCRNFYTDEAAEEVEANARLIAAAPDLITLLARYVVDHGDPIEGDCGCPMCEEANAVIGDVLGKALA
jgi:tRNA-dihydrouridine synthase